MGSVEKKQTGEKLVNVETVELKNRLNKLYSKMRAAANASRAEVGHFDSLWDLKELALLERRQSVDVPATWLAETEDMDKASRVRQGH